TASLAAISPKLVDSIDERSGRPAEGAPNIKEDLRGSVRPPADGKDSQVEQRRWSTLKLERGDTLSGILTARLGLSRPAML
ncbi:hypothetical protein, partial [Acinetobacter baumannii]|uniref:hypothetical protein n=1 Tax=Acinetobacter baumannii TaxID=470 RepID=UPI0037C7A7BD